MRYQVPTTKQIIASEFSRRSRSGLIALGQAIVVASLVAGPLFYYYFS